MIFVVYAVVAAAVVLLSDKASAYVDLLDKRTSLSGAFIGGVMLSAVTSLPELFTSLSSVLILDQPGMCLGNILGSDLFNLAMLAVVILIFFRSFQSEKVSRSHAAVSWFVLAIYGAVLLNMLGILRFEVFSLSITSIIIVVLYALSVRHLSGEEEAPQKDNSPLTLRQIVTRFVLAALGIIGLSVILTFITDALAQRLNLGAGLAGALFLGVATSLPELASTVALFRMKNYNVAIGNIVGSNIFNFLILSVTDLAYIGGTVYQFGDPSTVALLVLGAIATPVILLMLRNKNRFTQLICPSCTIGCYIAFLMGS